MTQADVRELALALPAVEERTSYGTPGFRVSDKLFARVLDEESIVIKVEFDHREALLQAHPDSFEVTPHYQDYPMVIVRLGAVKRELMRALLKEAWRMCASPRLLKAQATPESASLTSGSRRGPSTPPPSGARRGRRSSSRT
ncbi:MmcQ/YjbR family DNA-binding protein [Hyalangium minutum]|uniref:MmcQ/YjbR family DNA-binding protein n=1 Tax=Hyalangium minutum TaxID=394096 RepID=UPI00094AE2C6|nr:MmcQ/YjbR family DNA-binding protein [Hyalangium minutum]